MGERKKERVREGRPGRRHRNLSIKTEWPNTKTDPRFWISRTTRRAAAAWSASPAPRAPSLAYISTTKHYRMDSRKTQVWLPLQTASSTLILSFSIRWTGHRLATPRSSSQPQSQPLTGCRARTEAAMLSKQPTGFASCSARPKPTPHL